ncbi:4Fe-4S binding protein [Synergistaceae bacterium OttesenSCG-928-I11]|nr:4Fe-4S binding protein [Synergistaceae bacterium OttesenSCG-928-I11]
MKKAVVDTRHCVACGTCVKVCPKSAIFIDRGVTAVVDQAGCVGCGKCVKACPACLIRLEVGEK